MTPATKKQKTSDEDAYQLIYWPGLPGRGEPIRLMFEEAGVPYEDTAQQKKGVDKVLKHISTSFKCEFGNIPPLAPPVLRHGETLLSQSPVIMQYLAPKLGLIPEDERTRFAAASLVLTAMDLQNECHDTHHPIAPMLYYEDQKTEAKRKAKDFRESRIPKFFGYFSRVIDQFPGPYLLSTFTYADLVLFHVIDGVAFAFPKTMEKQFEETPKVKALWKAVKGRERVREYLESERRQDYADGVYRHYPELEED